MCKLARRLPVAASDRGFELALGHLGASLNTQALCLVVELLLRWFATDHWQMPPFVRGHSTPRRDGDSETPGVCEHLFVTPRGTAHGRFTRAIQQRNLWVAEMSLREMG